MKTEKQNSWKVLRVVNHVLQMSVLLTEIEEAFVKRILSCCLGARLFQFHARPVFGFLVSISKTNFLRKHSGGYSEHLPEGFRYFQMLQVSLLFRLLLSIFTYCHMLTVYIFIFPHVQTCTFSHVEILRLRKGLILRNRFAL